jgi:hypothetical protein
MKIERIDHLNATVADIDRRLEAMRETAANSLEAAGLYRTVGIPTVERLAAFHRGAYAVAVELLPAPRLTNCHGNHGE